MTTNTKFVQTPAVALYAGISGVATSLRIAPYPVDLDGVKLTMTDFGTTGYLTVDPKVSGYEEIISFTGLTDNGDNTATLTGLTRDLQSKYPYSGSGTGKTHGSSAVVVFSDNPQLYNKFPARDNDETITGQWTFSVFPITPSTPNASVTVIGMTKLSTAPVSSINPIAVGDNDIRIPPSNPDTRYALATNVIPSGIVSPYAGRTAPTGWLICDGTAVSRATYASLFTAISPSQVVTVTIASPAVFTATAHGLIAGDKVHLTTTGGLPSGLATNTDYFVISAGLTANAFEVSTSRGGSAVNTSGSQSGIHTIYASNHGKGDGSTTFNLPDYRGFTPYGQKTTDANFDVVNTPTTYVGEKTHVLVTAELAAHNHRWQQGQGSYSTNGPSGGGASGGGIAGASNTNNVFATPWIENTGSDTAHNNMSPYLVSIFIIKQ